METDCSRGARGGGDRSSHLVVADDDEFDRQEAARLASEVNLSAPPPKAATATGNTAANDERYPQNTVREHVIWHASCIDDVLSDRGTWNAVDATTTTCAHS